MSLRWMVPFVATTAFWVAGATTSAARPKAPGERRPTKKKPAQASPEQPLVRAFILQDELVAPANDPLATVVARVIGKVAQTKLRTMPGVVHRGTRDVLDAAKLIHARGDLRHLDRPALVALRTTTGLDGVTAGQVHSSPKGLVIRLWHVDLGQGRVVAERVHEGPLTAAVFTELERDLEVLANAARSTYRVNLEITSSPTDAQVRINGRISCKTPCALQLPDGEYDIEVSRDQHRPWRHRAFYKSGDRVQLVATLYNPVADRYLNRAPAFRLDSQALRLGYRYTYFDLSKPKLRELHALTLDYLLRFADFEAGVGLRVSGGTNAVLESPTFAPEISVRRSDEARLIAPMAIFKARILERFSFLTLWGGVAAGFSNVRVGGRSEWAFATDAFVEVTSRVGRSRNFSFELVLDAGFSYAGQLPFVEKTVSLFGDGPERNRLQPLLGVFGGFSLRFVGWNDIF